MRMIKRMLNVNAFACSATMLLFSFSCGATEPALLQSAAAPQNAESIVREALIDPAIPFSPDGQLGRTDTPSVFVWSVYQYGRAAGWYYRIYPDASAVFSPSPRLDSDRITVTCLRNDGCVVSRKAGDRRITSPTKATFPDGATADGDRVAEAYVAWVLSQLAKSEPIPVPGPAASQARPAKPPGTERPPIMNQRPARPPTAATPSEVTAALQSELVRHAFYQGPIDGILGTRTRAAIRRAEAAESMPETGTVSQHLLERLRQRQIPPPAPPQPSGTPPGRSSYGPAIILPEGSKLKKMGLECSTSAGYTFEYYDDATNSTRAGKLQNFWTCGLSPVERIYLRGSVVIYPMGDQQQPWDPDYTYSISYRITDQIALEYANYSGNRWPWHREGGTGGFSAGSIRLSYDFPSLPIPALLTEAHRPALSCSTWGAYTPQYDKNDGGQGSGKTSVAVSCGITPISRLTFRATAIFYPIPGQQQPWDPDYTYTATYQIDDQWSIEYANYAGNRWPWNDGEGTSQGLASGSLRLSYKWLF